MKKHRDIFLGRFDTFKLKPVVLHCTVLSSQFIALVAETTYYSIKAEAKISIIVCACSLASLRRKNISYGLECCHMFVAELLDMFMIVCNLIYNYHSRKSKLL